MVPGRFSEPSQYFVIDTSSLIAIRETIQASERRKVFEALTGLIENGQLVYPSDVFDELSGPVRQPDSIFEWAKSTRELATRFGYRAAELRQVMTHPIASKVIDPEKAAGPDEADPHVLALALALRENADVVVITEETRDRPGRISMTTACGALRLFRLPLRAFLAERKIWLG